MITALKLIAVSYFLDAIPSINLSVFNTIFKIKIHCHVRIIVFSIY